MEHEHEAALRQAVKSGEGFTDAAETEACSRWALAEIERLRKALERIASSDAPLSQDDMQIARDALNGG